MATEQQFEEEDDKAKDSGSTPLAGSSAPLASQAGGGAAPGTTRPDSPSSRPNIQQYIKANEGAGNTLSQGIQNKYQEGTQNFNKSLEEQKNQFNTSAGGIQQGLDNAGSQIQTAFKDPAKILADQTQLQSFNKIRDMGYKEDTSQLANQNSLQKSQLNAQLGSLGQQADLAKSEGGRFQLLQQAFGQPTYSRGQQKLDQLFLQAQPGVSKTLNRNLGDQQQQANQSLNQYDQATQAKLAGLNQLTQSRADEVQKMLRGGSEEGLEADVNSRGLDDINTNVQAAMGKAQALEAGHPGLVERLKTNMLTRKDAEVLGLNTQFFAGTQNVHDDKMAGYNDMQQKMSVDTLDPSQANIYNLNLADYIRQNAVVPTMASVADKDEFARYRALQQLSGNTGEDIFGGATEGGGYDPYGFKGEDLRKALQETSGKYNDTWANTSKGGDLADAWARTFGNTNVFNGPQSNYIRGDHTDSADYRKSLDAYNRDVRGDGGGYVLNEYLSGAYDGKYGNVAGHNIAKTYRDLANAYKDIDNMQGSRTLHFVDDEDPTGQT